MDINEKQKLIKSLQEEEKLILSELTELARKNPNVKGDFNVPFPNEGDSLDENAREITEFERTKAVVDNLEKRLKDISTTIEKLNANSYGVCEKCSVEISADRLQAMPTANLCINCAKVHSHEV
ncbi:MAG: TraR/DksA C4-type zinc finger protein [bacterium]|nr:TraR/DksA C4-type zinc finger protein [bacterium]